MSNIARLLDASIMRPVGISPLLCMSAIIDKNQVWQSYGEIVTYGIGLAIILAIVVAVARELRFYIYWRR